MKRYITMLAVVLCASSASYTEFAFGTPVQILPTTEGPDSIVNAIKQYSNVTQADVDQYNLLMLGSLDTFGAFILGAASTIGAGVGAYQKAGMVQGIAPESVPGWMTNALVLAGLGSAGVGYMSYKALYPRIREGVVEKVQNFINVCEGLNQDSPYVQTIVNFNFANSLELKEWYLPKSWKLRGDVAVYNALTNLAQQGKFAELLLNKLGSKDQFYIDNKTFVEKYAEGLEHNATKYMEIISTEDQRKLQALKAENLAKHQEDFASAQLADMHANVDLKKAGIGLANVTTLQKYSELVTDSIKNVWGGLNYVYKNKEKIMYRTSILSAAAYGGYIYLKNKLGYTE